MPAQRQAPPRKKKKTSFGVKLLMTLFAIFVVVVIVNVFFRSGGGSGSSSSSSRTSFGGPGSNEFDLANSLTISDNNGVVNGNTADARKLALIYSNEMALMRDIMFSAGKEKSFSLSGGQFLTYCAINGERCAFIVHVPQLRKFAPDAKESMNELAWITAWQVVNDAGLEINELAVGVKGAVQYSAVMTGKYDPLSGEVPDPTFNGKGISDTPKLYPFFAPVRAVKEPPAEAASADSTAPADTTAAEETPAAVETAAE